ncbi:MAG: sugar ABC transporter substrate-binding protein [Oscillospiraceae bacterium]
MNKFMKRTLAVALALCMSLSLAACGGNGDSGNKGNDENPSYYIGYNTWSAGTAVFDFMADIVEQALDAYGATYTRSSDETTADKELQNIQNFVSAGVDGIVMQTAAETVLPQAAEECGKAGIPFVMSVFTGNDDDRAKISAENKCYVGSVNADMYAEGYLMGQQAAADGRKTAVLLGGNVGDTHFEMRIAGFTKAFVEEGGGEILNTARCANPSEGQEKANAMLSATPNADCLFAMAGDYVPGAISAMESLDIDMPLYVTNADTSAIEYIRDGRVVCATTGNDLVGAVASALLINYLDGHQILDADGKAPELKITGFMLDQDNIDTYEEIFANKGVPFTEETLKTLAWRYNPDVTYDTFVDFIENQITLEAMAKAYGM